MKRAIIVMVKVPEAGKVKTRLQPFVSPAQSAELATCLLQDTISKAKALKNKLIIAYSPAERRSFFAHFRDLDVVAQSGNDLGERIFNAFQLAFEEGSDLVVMIGTDSPTFPVKFLTKAFETLAQQDAVLGQTEDGGYYLIGLRKSDKRIFENVEWSSARTFLQTKNNLEKLGFSLGELPLWYDIDIPEDLERLSQDEYLQGFAPKTAKWLKENLKELATKSTKFTK